MISQLTIYMLLQDLPRLKKGLYPCQPQCLDTLHKATLVKDGACS